MYEKQKRQIELIVRKRQRKMIAMLMLSVAVAAVVYAVLCLPAISAIRKQPTLETEKKMAALGETITVKVIAETVGHEENTIYALHTIGKEVQLPATFVFDEQGTSTITTLENETIVLHRQVEGEESTSYWFEAEAEKYISFQLEFITNSMEKSTLMITAAGATTVEEAMEDAKRAVEPLELTWEVPEPVIVEEVSVEEPIVSEPSAEDALIAGTPSADVPSADMAEADTSPLGQIITQPEITLENTEGGMSDILPMKVKTEIPVGAENMIFAVHSIGNGVALSSEYAFNSDNQCSLTGDGGTTVVLHRETLSGGEVNYWFELSSGLKDTFTFRFTATVGENRTLTAGAGVDYTYEQALARAKASTTKVTLTWKTTITATYQFPELSAASQPADMGADLEVQVKATGADTPTPTRFAIHTRGNGPGLSETQIFDENEVGNIACTDGTSIPLHRQRSYLGETNYWFELSSGQSKTFQLDFTSDAWMAPEGSSAYPGGSTTSNSIPDGYQLLEVTSGAGPTIEKAVELARARKEISDVIALFWKPAADEQPGGNLDSVNITMNDAMSRNNGYVYCLTDRYQYYQMGNVVVNKAVSSLKQNLPIYALIDTTGKSAGTTVSWKPQSKIWDENEDVLASYCAEPAQKIATNVFYKRQPLSSLGLSQSVTNKIRNVVMHSYPYISVEEMKNQMEAAGINLYTSTAVPYGTVREGELLTMAQQVIWLYIDSRYASGYADANYTSLEGEKCLNPLLESDYVKANTSKNRAVNEVYSNRTYSIYQYLQALPELPDPGGTQRNPITITGCTATHISEDKIQMKVTLSEEPGAKDELTLTGMPMEDTARATTVKADKKDIIFTVSGDALTSKVSVRLSGQLQQGKEVFIYQAAESQDMISVEDYYQTMTDSTATAELAGAYLKILKINRKNTPLQGAEFKLERAKNDGIWEEIGEIYTTDMAGVIDFGRLAIGSYQLTEAKAPAGYQQLVGAIKFRVTATDGGTRIVLDAGKAVLEGPNQDGGGNGNYLLTILNTETTPEKTSATVNKLWEEGAEPTPIQVQLYQQIVTEVTTSQVPVYPGKVTVNYNTGGTVSLSGVVLSSGSQTVVLKNYSKTFDITANTGYVIESLAVDGRVVTEAAGKTIYNQKISVFGTKESHALQVNFQKKSSLSAVSTQVRGAAVEVQSTTTHTGTYGEAVSLDVGAGWKYTWSDLPVGQTVVNLIENTNGDTGTMTIEYTRTTYKYYAAEISKLPGYTVIYSEMLENLTLQDGTTIEAAPFRSGTEGVSLTITNKKGLLNLSIYKVGESGQVLQGVEFELYKAIVQGENWTKGEKKAAKTTDTAGKVIFDSLETGQYLLYETKAAKGYICPDIPWRVTIDHTVGTIKIEAGATLPDKRTDGTYQIMNLRSYTVLPETGGSGTVIYTVTGIILMLVAAIRYLWGRRWKGGEAA